MPTQIEINIQKTRAHLTKLESFIQKYPKLFENSEITFGCAYYSDKPSFTFPDATLTGEILGKVGWIRRRETYTHKITYNWHREIDGILLTIPNAETHDDLSNQPVPPAAFPLCLEED